MNKIIVVVGPTGVGKTKLSVELAKKLDAVVINADSTQIFKDIDIGTAKITEIEKQGIPHYFINLKELNETYSVADFQREARDVLNILIMNKRNVIIVGGTGLYVKALLYDYKFPCDERIIIRDDYEELTCEELKNKVDSIYKDNDIHKNNRQRLVRFLNEYENNGKIIRNYKEKDNLKYDNVTFIGLNASREELYERINKRVDIMLEKGLENEARGLYNKNIEKCRNIIGYKELYNYFDGEITKEEAIEQIKKNTRKYAKRQNTWFKNQLDIKWFNTNFNDFNKTIKEVLKYLKID